jgi:hypothetical protein
MRQEELWVLEYVNTYREEMAYAQELLVKTLMPTRGDETVTKERKELCCDIDMFGRYLQWGAEQGYFPESVYDRYLAMTPPLREEDFPSKLTTTVGDEEVRTVAFYSSDAGSYTFYMTFWNWTERKLTEHYAKLKTDIAKLQKQIDAIDAFRGSENNIT